MGQIHNYGRPARRVESNETTAEDQEDGSTKVHRAYVSTFNQGEKMHQSQNSLPIVAALQSEEDALGRLADRLSLLEKDLEPLLSAGYPESPEVLNQSADQPHSLAVELSESNTKRVYRLVDRVNQLLQRLGA